MLRHVVMFRWVDGTTSGQIDAVSAGLDTLPAAIPEIALYRHGRDAGINTGNFEYVVVSDFESEADYLVYRDHPVHTRLISELLAPLIAQRCAVQVRLD